MSSLEEISDSIEDTAARLADDSAGAQILGAKDLIESVGTAALVVQDLTQIAMKQADIARQDYLSLLSDGDVMKFAGNRIVHQSEGMLEAVRAISAETDRLTAAHVAMWTGYSEVV